ncbi:hypothetical protein EJD97_022337 [Solanum chilense]|uniref:Uncharacterized protein n=1 Tax=Solanum chilense TaxID=4083 RepID=A0A6N2AXS0_SOLCI|nr:hypothetical protein EJD97_022337 [Solanum chilense]
MPSHNLINVGSRIILGSVSRLHRNKVGKLNHLVHNNPYGVMLSPSPRKNNHEVYINGLSLPYQNLNNLSKTTRLKMFYVNLLIIRTLGHIFCNVLLHAIPPINMLKIMINLGGTRIYGISGTMGLYKNSGPQIIHIWQTQPILMCNDQE